MRTEALAHRALLRTFRVGQVRGVNRVWRQAHDAAVKRWGSKSVETRLHGSRATVNFANPYPYAIRLHPNYNAPQVELVAASATALGRPVTVVDVGAAIGDTALLLLQRCSSMIKALECIEGDPAFAELLRKNLRDPRIQIHEVVLSDRPGPVPSLIRSQHQGTASAHGDEVVSASTLDEQLAAISPDVIKVDTDGYDGAILGGADDLLKRARPPSCSSGIPRSARWLDVTRNLRLRCSETRVTTGGCSSRSTGNSVTSGTIAPTSSNGCFNNGNVARLALRRDCSECIVEDRRGRVGRPPRHWGGSGF